MKFYNYFLSFYNFLIHSYKSWINSYSNQSERKKTFFLIVRAFQTLVFSSRDIEITNTVPTIVFLGSFIIDIIKAIFYNIFNFLANIFLWVISISFLTSTTFNRVRSELINLTVFNINRIRFLRIFVATIRIRRITFTTHQTIFQILSNFAIRNYQWTTNTSLVLSNISNLTTLSTN